MERTEDRGFGALLRTHRAAAGLSQEALAERARLSRRTITNLERGVSTPYRETVALLAEALQLTEDDRAELERAVQRARSLLTINQGGPAGVDPLVATKLAIPPARSMLVPRPHLIERLQAGARGPLTLLSAPAGSGKTTLLSAWRTTPAGRETPLAWVALDEGDNDSRRFWHYVLTALDRAVPGISAAALALLQSSDAASLEAVLTALVNGLAEQGTDVVLILDDYHLIEADSIHRMLAVLLEWQPPCLHILVSTRADPPLPLARLRVRGAVAELRAADLRFSAEETAAFLRTVMALALAPDEMAALEARTEGWIAGLQLAGLSLQGRSAEDATTFIREFTGSHRYIVDYLLDEVLLRQPEEVQRFLLHTCILGRLCAPLCATVLEGENPPFEHIAAGQEMLEWLERHNLFLIALDDERRWYRYHYLFADALRQRQRGHQAVPEAPVLHRRAGAWFAQQDLVDEAIGHALAGGDFDAAAALLPRATRPVGPHGNLQGLSAWYQALPEAMLRARPQMALGYVWILLDFRDFQRAEEYLHHAEVALQTSPDAYSPDERDAIHAAIEADRALIAVLRGDPDGAMGRAQAVLAGLEADGTTRSATGVAARSIAGIALGLAYLSRGAASRAVAAFRDVAAAHHAPYQALLQFLAAVGEACALRLAGSLDLARSTYERAIPWSVESPQSSLLAGALYTGLADILRERNELDAALERATQGISLMPELGAAGAERWIEWQVGNLLVLARIKQAQGDLVGALADVHAAQEQLEGSNATSFTAILGAFEAQLHLAQGDVDSAVRWLRSAEAGPVPRRVGVTPQVFVYLSEHLEIAPVQVLIAQGRASRDRAFIHRALALLDQLPEEADRSDLVWLRAKTLVLQALARQALGEMAAALSALDEALVLAEPGGHMRLFLDEGPALAELLRERRTGGATPDYAAALLVALESRPNPDIQKAEPLPDGEALSPALTEPLTEREREVLRLLAIGQSNPEIARALSIEVNTVKTHLKRLYDKLGVHSRMQAVRRAQEISVL